MSTGKLFTFEGLTSSTKDTVFDAVAQKLRDEGYSVTVTSEPYSDELQPILRDSLTNDTWSEKARLFLYMADHFYHVDKVIKPALENGDIVLCDRYVDSRCAYQAAGLSDEHDQLTSNIHWINSVHNKFHFITPDKTFLFDMSSDAAAEEATNSEDEYIITDQSFLSRIRTAYHFIAELNPNRIEIKDADKNTAELSEEVYSQITVLADS